MENINRIKKPRAYNLIINDSDDLDVDALKKVLGDTFGYDFIYASQKVLELKNAGKIEMGVYSYDIAMTLEQEICAVIQNISIDLSEVSAK